MSSFKYPNDSSKKYMNEPNKGYKNYNAAMELMMSVPDGDFNPYDYIDQSYYKNTARGRMAYQEDLARLLYMAQIAQEDRMNEYNSPEEQVKRMREAGLNPDLQGISNEPASNVAGYQGNPMDGTSTTLQSAGDVFGIISTVTSMVSGLASGITGISLAGVQKLGASISSASSLFDLFDKSVLTDDNNGKDIFIEDLLPSLSHKQRSKISRLRSVYTNSTKGQTSSNSKLSEFLRSRGELHSLELDPKYSDVEDEYIKAWKPLIDAMSEFAVKEYKSKSAKSDYDSSYYSADKAKSDLDYESNQRDFEKDTQKWFRNFKQPFAEVMENLDLIKNEEFRYICKAALATVMLKYLPL